METRYCVYLTIYSGNKLPPFYIGSTNLARIKSGYCGSVTSREYRDVWRSELRNNPHLFTVKVIKICVSRSDAYDAEEKIQRQLDVVKNPLYINFHIANTVFSSYGKRWKYSEEHACEIRNTKRKAMTPDKLRELAEKISKTRIERKIVPWNKDRKIPTPNQDFRTAEYREKQSKSLSDRNRIQNPMFNEETRNKIRGPKPLCYCNKCNKRVVPRTVKFHEKCGTVPELLEYFRTHKNISIFNLKP